MYICIYVYMYVYMYIICIYICILSVPHYISAIYICIYISVPHTLSKFVSFTQILDERSILYH